MTFQLMTLPEARERFTPRSGTAFGQFTEWVMAMNTSGAPIEEILAAGLWVVMLSAGKKLGINLATPTQIEDVGNRVDRLVNVGLNLKYKGNMFEAANAFEREVLNAVERACKLGLRPGMNVTPTAWRALLNGNAEAMRRELTEQSAKDTGPFLSLVQIPAALFLMDLLREAEAMKTEIGHLTELSLKRNLISTKNADRVLMGSVSPDSGNVALQILSLEYAFEADKTDQTKLVVESLREAKHTLRAQSLYGKLPYRQSDFIEDEGATIDEGWINSQLYLAAGDQPDGAILNTSTNWVPCVQALTAAPAEETVNKFFKRLSARGLKLPEAEERWLTRELIEKITWWHGQKNPYQVDMSGTFHLIIELEAADLEPANDEALKLATGQSSVESYSRHLSSAEGDAALADKTFAAINWDVVTAEQINDMLFTGTFNADRIAEGVTHMSEKEREKAVERLTTDEELGPKGVETLLISGLLVLTPELVSRLGRKISTARLKECLDRWLGEATEDTDESLSKPLVICLSAMTPSKLKAYLLKAERRQALVRNVTAIIAHKGDVYRANIDQLDAETIKSATGSAWNLFVLALEIQIRQSVYHDADAAEDTRVQYEPPWEHLGHPLFTSHAQDALELGDNKATKGLLKKYPEDEVFRWLHEADPELEAKLKAYQELRKRYYKRFPYSKMRKLAEQES